MDGSHRTVTGGQGPKGRRPAAVACPRMPQKLIFSWDMLEGEATLPPRQRQCVPEPSKSRCLSWDTPVGQGSSTWAIPTNRRHAAARGWAASSSRGRGTL